MFFLFKKNRYFFHSYGREFAEPYLGHSIGPVSGYGVCLILIFFTFGLIHYHSQVTYRGAFNRFTPY